MEKLEREEQKKLQKAEREAKDIQPKKKGRAKATDMSQHLPMRFVFVFLSPPSPLVFDFEPHFHPPFPPLFPSSFFFFFAFFLLACCFSEI